MKKFLKESSLFYGVVIFLSLFLFLRPSTIGTLTAAQMDMLKNLYIYFTIAMLLCLGCLALRSYLYAKVRYGTIKSIEDRRYGRINTFVYLLMLLGIINILGAVFYEFPKLYKLMNTGLGAILGGSTGLSFTVTGMLIIFIVFIYSIIATQLMEEDLPRRRRSVKLVKLEVTEFFKIFLPHIPTLISLLIVVNYIFDVQKLVK